MAQLLVSLVGSHMADIIFGKVYCQSPGDLKSKTKNPKLLVNQQSKLAVSFLPNNLIAFIGLYFRFIGNIKTKRSDQANVINQKILAVSIIVFTKTTFFNLGQ